MKCGTTACPTFWYPRLSQELLLISPLSFLVILVAMSILGFAYLSSSIPLTWKWSAQEKFQYDNLNFLFWWRRELCKLIPWQLSVWVSLSDLAAKYFLLIHVSWVSLSKTFSNRYRKGREKTGMRPAKSPALWVAFSSFRFWLVSLVCVYFLAHANKKTDSKTF